MCSSLQRGDGMRIQASNSMFSVKWIPVALFHTKFFSWQSYGVYGGSGMLTKIVSDYKVS
jgi:hypothetical protein